MDPELKSIRPEIIAADTAPAGLLVLDDDGCIVFINRLAAELLDFDQEAAAGRPLKSVVDRVPSKTISTHLEKARNSASIHRLEITTSDSSGCPQHILLQTLSSPYKGDERSFQVILTDISAYVKRVQAAESERTAAELRATANTEMLAVLSHEIRSVLASMVGFADILQTNASGENEELAKSIMGSGRHLLDTLSAVLDLARFDSQEANLETEEVDVIRTAREQTAHFRPTAEKKSLDLTFRAETASVAARINATFLDRILYNLIDNAIKYTPKGKVEVSVEEREGRVWIYVADTGVGIGEPFMPRLFSSFERESQGVDASVDGVGLGLTVTKRLVELMGGSIAVCSTRGEGSTFTVSFPALKRPRKVAEA